MADYQCDVLYKPDSDALRFLPEGPYTLDRSRLSWVGIQHGPTATVGSLNLLNLETGENETHELPGRPGFAFPTNRPGLFVAGVERQLGLFDTSDGSWTVLADGVDAEVSGTIINDGVVHADNLVFGCKDLQFAEAKAGLYLWRGRDQKLIRLRTDQTCSNGKAVVAEADGLALLDIDTPTKTLVSYPLDIGAGSLGDPRVVLDLNSEDAFPDGMIVTPDGKHAIIAFYNPNDVPAGEARQYDLATGDVCATWTCPNSPQVTCPQLVQAGERIRLVLTTAVEHMSAERQAVHTAAGCLFIGDTEFASTGAQPALSLS